MFILFGHRATKIAEETKKVNENGYFQPAIIQIYQRYAHIFWVPLFPLYRNYVLFFPETGAIYEKNLFQKMPENYKEICREVSRNARTPWWTFIGIILLGLLIFWLERNN